jgi:hypothetical protein
VSTVTYGLSAYSEQSASSAAVSVTILITVSV